MFELVKLDDFFTSLLCCPICKGAIEMGQGGCYCEDCGMFYSAIGKSYDFRIRYPSYCLSPQLKKWHQVQSLYESFARKVCSNDDISCFLGQIDSVKEIYQEEFHLSGSVLDVGGSEGILRYFLNLRDPVNQYCSIDPFVEVVRDAQFQSNFVRAYPCLKEPLNFVAGIAERLPFLSKSFDYVHMRSVLDHFYDPYIALKETYRVLNPKGRLLIGLSVIGGESSLDGSKISRLRKKLRDQGLRKTTKAIIYKSLESFLKPKKEDDHMFYWKYDDLVDLVGLTGFQIEKIYWQKPPFEHCVYVLSQKVSTQERLKTTVGEKDSKNHQKNNECFRAK